VGVRFLVGARDFSPLLEVETGSGVHPMGTTDFSCGVNMPGREAAQKRKRGGPDDIVTRLWF
jgi:hypothetical protein